jgi:hypothetical protein
MKRRGPAGFASLSDPYSTQINMEIVRSKSDNSGLTTDLIHNHPLFISNAFRTGKPHLPVKTMYYYLEYLWLHFAWSTAKK